MMPSASTCRIGYVDMRILRHNPSPLKPSASTGVTPGWHEHSIFIIPGQRKPHQPLSLSIGQTSGFCFFGFTRIFSSDSITLEYPTCTDSNATALEIIELEMLTGLGVQSDSDTSRMSLLMSRTNRTACYPRTPTLHSRNALIRAAGDEVSKMPSAQSVKLP